MYIAPRVKFMILLALVVMLTAVVIDAGSSMESVGQADGRFDPNPDDIYKRDASEGNGNDGETARQEEDSSSGADRTINCTLPINANNSACLKSEEDNGYVHSIMEKMSQNKGMLLRTLYVTLGVTGLVVIYFVVRAVRLRRRRTKSRKYGIITQSGDHGDMEMEPLGDGDDEDDDYTVFELNGRKK